MIIYLASPFFNEEQVTVVKRLEEIIENADCDLISPRQSGLVIANMTADEKMRYSKVVFSTNVHDIERADAIIAVIDDRDTGTIWEMGYGHAKGKPVYSFTNHNYGVNVMLTGCIRGHAKGYDALERMLEKITNGGDTSEFAIQPST